MIVVLVCRDSSASTITSNAFLFSILPQDGTFIVRDSTKIKGEYSLSLWFGGGVRHLRYVKLASIMMCYDRSKFFVQDSGCYC